MPQLKVSVRDSNAPSGGIAVITFGGAFFSVSPLFLRIQRFDRAERYLGPSGWQVAEVEVPVLSSGWEGDTLVAELGPDIVDHMFPGLPLEIAIRGTEHFGTVNWPEVMPSIGARRATSTARIGGTLTSLETRANPTAAPEPRAPQTLAAGPVEPVAPTDPGPAPQSDASPSRRDRTPVPMPTAMSAPMRRETTKGGGGGTRTVLVLGAMATAALGLGGVFVSGACPQFVAACRPSPPPSVAAPVAPAVAAVVPAPVAAAPAQAAPTPAVARVRIPLGPAGTALEASEIRFRTAFSFRQDLETFDIVVSETATGHQAFVSGVPERSAAPLCMKLNPGSPSCDFRPDGPFAAPRDGVFAQIGQPFAAEAPAAAERMRLYGLIPAWQLVDRTLTLQRPMGGAAAWTVVAGPFPRRELAADWCAVLRRQLQQISITVPCQPAG
jgi:hypothetical protein